MMIKSVFNFGMMTKGRKGISYVGKHKTKRNWNYVQMTIYKTLQRNISKNMSCGYPRYAERNYGS